MRSMKNKTLKEIIKRDNREASKGRVTYYRVDYQSYGHDPASMAFLQTRNKQYILYRRMNNKDLYEVLKINKKN